MSLLLIGFTRRKIWRSRDIFNWMWAGFVSHSVLTSYIQETHDIYIVAKGVRDRSFLL